MYLSLEGPSLANFQPETSTTSTRLHGMDGPTEPADSRGPGERARTAGAGDGQRVGPGAPSGVNTDWVVLNSTDISLCFEVDRPQGNTVDGLPIR